MMTVLIRWTVQDRYGNTVYLTEERWQHIIEVINHPEMEDYEDELKETVHLGARRQDPLNPQKYRYTKAFDNLPSHNTHIVAIVLFGLPKTISVKSKQITLSLLHTRKK